MARITDRSTRRERTSGKGVARGRDAAMGAPASGPDPATDSAAGAAGPGAVAESGTAVAGTTTVAGTAVANSPRAAATAGAPAGVRPPVDTPPPAAGEEPGGASLRAPGPIVSGSGTIPPFSLTVSGLLVVLLGAWAGISVFVGPVFGYDPGGPFAWTWTRAHALLYLAPGVAGVVAGLMLLSGVGPAAHGFGRGVTRVAGSLAALAGAWLIIGPSAWPLLSTPGVVWGSATGTTLFLRQIGANFGVGALLLGLGAYTFGLAGQARRVTRSQLVS